MACEKGGWKGGEVSEEAHTVRWERRKHRRCWQIGRHDRRLSRDLFSKHEQLMPTRQSVTTFKISLSSRFV